MSSQCSHCGGKLDGYGACSACVTLDPKIVDLHGKPVVARMETGARVRLDRNQREARAAAAVANMLARVQNMESVMVMLACTVKKIIGTDATADERLRELNVYMECWYMAQVARGARHLEQAADGDEDRGDVFV